VQAVARTPDRRDLRPAISYFGDFGGVPGPVTGTLFGEPFGKALGVPGCFTGVVT
jgi:hypothetical protein